MTPIFFMDLNLHFIVRNYVESLLKNFASEKIIIHLPKEYEVERGIEW